MMVDKINRLGRKARLGIFAAMVAAFAIVPGVAFAESSGVETMVGDELGNLESMVTGTLGPALLTLAVVGVVIGLGIKYLRKGRSSA
jgi:type IV secretory pathway VirB2 component (pilin)